MHQRVDERLLAMCDATTHDPVDLMRMDLTSRERTGEIDVMR